MVKMQGFLIGIAASIGAVLLASCGGPVPPAHGQVANDTLTWVRPVTRTDGSALAESEILQYNVRWGATASGPFTGSAVAPGAAQSWVRDNRPEGRACYQIQTVDTGGLLSSFAPPVPVTVCTEKCLLGKRITAAGTCEVTPVPNPPTEVRVQ